MSQPSAPANPAPDNTAVRTALWRALHLEIDGPPPVFDDSLALALANPPQGWRERGDMHPMGTRGYRAWIVARARYVEDVLAEQIASGLDQYVILGAGLDTFAQRRPDALERLEVYEVDQPGPQAWKRQRLEQLGYTAGTPQRLHFVPVDFEAGGTWWDGLATAGFDSSRPALVSSMGVSMYLTKEANAATLRQIAGLAHGTTVVMTFQLTTELLDPEERPGREMVEKGARAAGTPFLSFYAPEEVLAAARDAGFRDVRHVSGPDLSEKYFTGRADGLVCATGEDLLVATV